MDCTRFDLILKEMYTQYAERILLYQALPLGASSSISKILSEMYTAAVLK